MDGMDMSSTEVMFTYATERVTREFTMQADALLREMYAHSVASSDIPPYDFDWRKYRSVQDAGMLMLATARYEEMLVGFALYLIVDHPHHIGTRSAECDAIAINMGLRGNGIGQQLIDYALDQLRAIDTKFVTHRFRTCYDAEPIFPKLGFRLIEHVYMKDL
jgi:GNAT superfamily N-acetyltransferase